MPSLRRFAVAGILGVLLLTTAVAGERELLRDSGFKQGFRLLKPEPGNRIISNVLEIPGNELAPVWEVAQWSSRWPALPAEAKQLGKDVLRWENPGKSLVLCRKADQAPELTLSILGSAEFGENVRQQNEPWPHLLVEQHITEPPALSELSELHLKLQLRLESSRLNVPERYDPSRHAAQFLLYFHISNMDRTSKEFGQYLHFGVPLYDNRYPAPGSYFAPDTGGTGMVIFTPGSAEFMATSAHEGSWIEINRDILPLIRAGLERAWASGYLTDRRDLNAYRVTFITFGWELPGNLDVSVQIRGLSVRGVTQP